MLTWLRNHDAHEAFATSDPPVEIVCLCWEKHRLDMLAQTSFREPGDANMFGFDCLATNVGVAQPDANEMQSSFIENC